MTATAPASAPSGPRPVRAPHGTTLRCRGWVQEAALRIDRKSVV